MVHPLEPGRVIAKRTRTISVRNWPFVAFLLIVASSIGIPAGYATRSWLPIAAVFGLVWLFPAVVFVVELFGHKELDEVTVNGVVWQRGTARGFLPWAQLRLESECVEDGEGGPPVTLWWLRPTRADVPRLSITWLDKGTMDFIASKLDRSETVHR